MTEQTNRNEWAAPASSPYQADPAWYDRRPVEHRKADADAEVPEATMTDSAIDEQPADPSSAVDESATEEAGAGHATSGSPNGRNGAGARSVDETAEGAHRDAAESHDPGVAVADTSSPEYDIGEHAPAAGLAAETSGTGVTAVGELLPGAVVSEPVTALLDAATTTRFRDRWQQLQLRFIDDPHTAAAQAGVVVDEVVTALHDAIDRRRSAVEPEQPGDDADAHAGDTERLRMSMRRHRDFLDHLLSR